MAQGLPSLHVAGLVGARGISVRGLVVCSGPFLLLQVAATDYGNDRGEAAGFWLVVGAFLLWCVDRRRSWVAWVLLIGAALFGAVLFGSGAMEDGRSAYLAIMYAGQAVPLVAGPVRRHVMGEAGD